MTTQQSISTFSTLLQERIKQPLHAWSDHEFFRLALDLFRLQVQQVPVYRDFCRGRGIDPECVDDWREIPAVPTAAFKAYPLSSVPVAGRIRLFRSSGTTGAERSCHYHGSESMRLYEASLTRWFGANVLEQPLTFGMNLLVLTPSGETAPESSLVHMFETVGRTWPFGSQEFVGELEANGGWRLKLSRATAMLKKAEQVPLLVLGTAFSFVHLLEHLEVERVQFRLAAGSKLMETGGYKGRSREVSKAELRRWMAARLGVKPAQIVSEYGMSELSSQAYDRPASGPTDPRAGTFRFAPWARARIVSPETGREVQDGEVGLVQVLDLANAWSVAAVQTEDLGRRRGAEFELLGRVGGAEVRGCSVMVSELGSR